MVNIKIIDNFLNKDDFNELCSLNIKNVKSNCVDVYNNFIDKNGSIKGSLIKDCRIESRFESPLSPTEDEVQKISPIFEKLINIYQLLVINIYY